MRRNNVQYSPKVGKVSKVRKKFFRYNSSISKNQTDYPDKRWHPLSSFYLPGFTGFRTLLTFGLFTSFQLPDFTDFRTFYIFPTSGFY